MSITLYDLAAAEDDRRFSPYCWRIKMALKHKGLPFETIAWRFTEKEVIAFAGSTTVPVLVDGGNAVNDSWNIAQYLEQAYPSRPGLFEGAEAQALCLFFNQWTARAIHPPILRVVLLDLFELLAEKDRSYFRASREKRFGTTLEQAAAEPKKWLAELNAALEPLRTVLAQNAFICGKGPGYADYILFGAFQWARSVSPARLLEHDDPAFAWRERMLDLWDGYARRSVGYEV